MEKEKKYTPLEDKKADKLYGLKYFFPLDLDMAFLRRLGISCSLDDEVVRERGEGVEKFRRLLEDKRLTAPAEFSTESVKLDEHLQVHNYTGMCPLNVFEINPSSGSCSLSCLYCLVSDGKQRDPIVVNERYPELVGRELVEHKDKDHFFYLSPKTEAFSEPLLESGVAHNILLTFIKHYQKYPESRVKLFIASKAGTKQLKFKYRGDNILSLLGQISGRVQFNGSIGLMPNYLHDVLEPNAPSIEDRLNAISLCQDKGIYAFSVLAQPILPCYLNEDGLHSYMRNLSEKKIINIKPEFLTVNFENLAIIAQYVNHFDPHLIGPLLESYISKDNRDHVKQRSRTAPSRELSLQGIQMINRVASQYGISTSICNWVVSEVNPHKKLLHQSSSMGFRCLGYQRNLFKND